MRIRAEARPQLCGNDRLACIKPQLLTDQQVQAVHTGCNIVFDTSSLRGKVDVLKNAARSRLQKVG